jgi:hypothetical protein
VVSLHRTSVSEPPPNAPWLRRAVLASSLLVVALGCGLVAVHFVGSPTRFGPHDATARLRFDGRVTFDAGPLGSIAAPVDLPVGLGVEIDLHDIPEVAGSPNRGFTDQELRAYASLYTTPEADAARVERALVGRFLLGFAVGLVAALLLYAYPGRDRRRALARRVGGPVRAGLAVIVCGAVAVGGFLVAQTLKPSIRSNVDPVFVGTPLQDAAVRGRWMQILVNDLGAQFLTLLDENRDFYAAVERRGRAAVRRAALPRTEDTLVTAVLVEGLKCNEGMMGVVGALVDELDPAFVLSAGDDSLTSVGLEQLCVDALASALRGHDLVAAPGNHDSLASRLAMRARGFDVLAGETVEHSGLVILGDEDPRLHETLGARTRLGRETIDDVAERLGDVACEEGEEERGVDITIVNQPAALAGVIDRGCTKLAIAGGVARDYSLRTATNGRVVPRYLAASAGGDTSPTASGAFSTLGPLRAPAEITLLTFSRASHRPLAFHVLTVSPDRSVTVSSATPFPYGTTPTGRAELASRR